jgi:hypothetical protein
MAAIGLRAIFGPARVSLILAGSTHPSPTATPRATPTASPAPGATISARPAPTFPVDPNGPRLTSGVALGNGVHGNALLLAGNDHGAIKTYYWDGVSWRITSTPNPRALNSRPVFDPALGKTIMIAGGDMGNALETWQWGGSNWADVNTSLPGLTGPAILGIDAATNQLIMTTGSTIRTASSVTTVASTWVFDGTKWQQVAATVSPEQRSATNMAYDPRTGQLVLFGGLSFQDGAPFKGRTDTWIWDGTSWTQRHPAVSPQGGFDSLVYDPDTQQLLLLEANFVGLTKPVQLTMWSWDGVNWHQLHPAALPVYGPDPQMTYDSANHQIVLFEGTLDHHDLTPQTWVYQGGTWKQVA